MDAFKSFAFLKRIPLLGFLGVFILLIFSGLGIAFQVPMKIIVIGWTAFLAMSVAAAIGIRVGDHHPKGLVWSYGLASGAMVTSAAIFLIPPAINHHPTAGSIGIAGGLITGFSGHTIGHRLTHYNLPLDRTIAELTAHAITTGTIIGIIYISLPVLGPLLGLAVISHKAPAGYVAARRLQQANISTGIIGLPASVVGIFAIGTNLLPLTISPILSAGIFGFGAGIFLHLAMDFLPRCETGGEIHSIISSTQQMHSHTLLDRLRFHALGSTIIGAAVVIMFWRVI